MQPSHNLCIMLENLRMWASENKAHLQVPYESAFEFCVLNHYLSLGYIKAKKKKKRIRNKTSSLLKIKLKCQCIIIKGKHCSTHRETGARHV